MQKTALFQQHIAAHGKMIDFAGWQMPLHYGSQIEEHHHVRQKLGMFDVSHMVIIDIKGEQSYPFLRYLLANDVAKLSNNQALYSCILNDNGGIIDDLMAYRLSDNYYRLVVNAATRAKDLAWIQKQTHTFTVDVIERTDLSMIAIQGPKAREKLVHYLNKPQLLNILPFYFTSAHDTLIARTGYTGEDGFEFMLPHQDAIALWHKLMDAKVQPCGLGARDTLRLEAGMCLYGTDMDERFTPLESGLTWTVAKHDDRQFIGKQALLDQHSTLKLTGIILEEKGVLREGQTIQTDYGNGIITSGTFSPTLGHGIAIARLPKAAQGQVSVIIRNKTLPATMTKLPFVRHGQKAF